MFDFSAEQPYQEVNSRPATKIASFIQQTASGQRAKSASTGDHKMESACLSRALQPIPARPNALTFYRSTAGNSDREAFTVSREQPILFTGRPLDSRSGAQRLYLPDRTQTMAIITMCRFVSTFEWTIPRETGRFRQTIRPIVRSLAVRPAETPQIMLK